MKKNFWLSILLGIAGTLAGIWFRDFWKSDLGPYAFILLVSFLVSAVLSWGGRGRPLAIPFGLTCGAGLGLGLLVTLHTNPYVGLAVLGALLWLGLRTKFFERRSEQLLKEEQKPESER